ncbi:MAG: homocysteine S-methyltransferase family protein, partial [Pseudomonadota bacterium]
MLADGAMGTMLYARGVPFDQCFDTVNLTDPAVVRGIHQSYLDAGAELLETNTFGANRVKLAAHGYAERAAEVHAAGVALAGDAASAEGRPVWVGGSVG